MFTKFGKKVNRRVKDSSVESVVNVVVVVGLLGVLAAVGWAANFILFHHR